jgi:hypothetical protein
MTPTIQNSRGGRIDLAGKTTENTGMNSIEETGVSPELMAELQEAANRAAKGIRDLEAMRIACERMDRLGEEIYMKHGVLDIGVPAIRELRDQ